MLVGDKHLERLAEDLLLDESCLDCSVGSLHHLGQIVPFKVVKADFDVVAALVGNRRSPAFVDEISHKCGFKKWIKWCCDAKPVPTAGSDDGKSDFGGLPHIARLLRWPPRLPETFWETQKTPCYVRVYIIHNMKKWIVPVINSRLSISVTRHCSHLCGKSQFPGCLYKVTKILA